MIVYRLHVKAFGIAAALLITLTAVTPQSGCSRPRRTPRLAVVVVVDMFPGDSLARYGEHFGDGGFKRLVNKGAHFINAHFSHAGTLTGPGHATIVTGTTPSGHGIIGNYWYRPGEQAAIGCVDDEDRETIGSIEWYDPEGFSPHMLAASTLGDELKSRYGPESKVWSFSLKPRAALLAAGKSADGAIWFSTKSGDFVSTNFYFNQVPAWCLRLNEERFADKFLGATWDRVLPENAYAKCDIDDAPYETGPRVLWLNVLPKILGQAIPTANRMYYEQLQSSPFGNELVFEAARRAVIHEALGQDDIPDLLVLSLSSVDYCGHLFSPDSHEMLDMMVRTDQQLASWLEFLDREVGPDQYVLVLTGDHGVGPAPERAQRAGLGGGRIDLSQLFTELHDALVKEFGPTEEKIYYLTAINLPWIYLNEPVLRYQGVDLDQAAALVADVAARHDGVNTALVAGGLKNKPPESLTPLERAVVNGVFAKRSGQVYLHLERYWYRTGVCAGHGSLHNYDTHVPVVLAGDAFRPGRYDQRIEIRDLAVTLSEVLDIQPPSRSTGRVLREALAR